MLRRGAWPLLLVLSLRLPAGAAPAHPLWTRAVEAASRAKQWSPGEMRLAIEMSDDQGKVLDTWDNRYRISTGPDGAVRTEVVSAFHNGKDETAKEREAQAKRDRGARRDGGSPMAGFGDDPFDPASQDSVEIRKLDGTREISGAPCVAFAFVLTKKRDAATEGTAWLDAATGLPVQIVSSPRPLPMGAHELSTVVRYAGGLAAEIRIEGSGSLLFLKRRFRSVVTLEGWFRRLGG